MSQRAERVAGEIRGIVAEIVARQAIKDPRVRDAALVTITRVNLSGDLRQAHLFFTVHDAGEAARERVRRGFESASGFLRREIGARLRMKVTPSLTFEFDRGFEEAEKVELLLRDIDKPSP